MVAFLLTLALGQLPADQVNQQQAQQQQIQQQTQQQADWLLGRLSDTMLASGKYDAAKLEQARVQLTRLSSAQVAALVEYFQRLSQSQNQQLGQATANLNQALMQRNQLQLELGARTRPPFLSNVFGAPLGPSPGLGFGYGPQGLGYGGLNVGVGGLGFGGMNFGYGGLGAGFGGMGFGGMGYGGMGFGGAGFGGMGPGYATIGLGYGAPPYAPGYGSPLAGPGATPFGGGYGQGVPGIGMW